MKLFCPVCGQEIPPEDQDVMRPPDLMLVSQVECRRCDKVFTICQERKLLKVIIDKKKGHPENL